MKKTTYILLILISFISCKEVYNPELTPQSRILVIDGLITDEHREHKVRLSRTVRIDTLTNISETGASVYVQNDKGETFEFRERTAGYYYSDSLKFRTRVGDKYKLFVTTRDGKTYASQEQELLPRLYLNNISTKAREVPYYLTVDNKLKKYNLKGADFFATQTIQTPQDKFCRFSNVMIAEYTSITLDVLSYCWKKYDANVFPLINEIQNSNPGEIQHKLGFHPLNVYFFGIFHYTRVEGRPPREITTYNYLYHYFVSIKQYHMNQNIFEIYQLINKQLQADNKIFDPVNLQVKGNITCTSDPDEQVFGLFDVSSVSINTYMIDSYNDDDYYRLTPIKPVDFDTIPINGFVPHVPPSTWLK